jgi:single-strand DNA-binding protein
MKTISIAGRTTRDAELRHTGGGDAVLSFSVAVDDRSGKEKTTLFFDCSVWGKRAAALAPHIVKGMSVAVSGDIGTREHLGKTYLTVRVNELTMLGGGEKKEAAPKRSTSYDRDDPRTRSTAQELNDDLPF